MSGIEIHVLELRRLLYELKDQRQDIYIRCRLVGALWQPSFLRVVQLTDAGVVLLAENSSEVTTIADLREVVQFELDGRYQNFHPHNHYWVETTMNITERHANPGS